MHVMHDSSFISYDSYLAHAYFRCTLLCSHPCSSLLHSSLWLCGKHLTWVRASWPLTHGQAGSRWQRGAGCSTSRSSVAICNATERAATAFCCWLCFLCFLRSRPLMDFDPGLRSFDGCSSCFGFLVDGLGTATFALMASHFVHYGLFSVSGSSLPSSTSFLRPRPAQRASPPRGGS